jgi:hypothetical protein
MGWFGTDPLDGDDGMDCRAEVFHFCDIDYDLLEDSSEKTFKFVKNKLSINQDKLYDWIRDYNWGNYNPGFKQMVYIQALLYIFLEYDIEINYRGFTGGLVFVVEDEWAKVDEERKESMDNLYARLVTKQVELILSKGYFEELNFI